MTGANKRLVANFVVLKAVERHTAWAESPDAEAYDEDHAAEALSD